MTFKHSSSGRAVGSTRFPTMRMHFRQALAEAPWSVRHGHTCVWFHDRFVLAGGCVAEGTDPATIKRDVWTSPDGVTWSCLTESAEWPDRYLQQMLNYRGRLWTMGGMHRYRPDRVNLNDVWISDDAASWQRVTGAAPWPPRHVFSAVVHDDRMWVIAGAPDGMVYFNDVWSSQDGLNWTEHRSEQPCFSVRKSPACVSFRDRLWIIGGNELVRPAVSRTVHDVWSSEDGAEWRCETPAAAWSARDFPQVVVWRDRMWLFGGREERPDGHVSDIWWSQDGVTWHFSEDQTPWPVRHCSAMQVHDDQLWLFGGCVSGQRAGHFNDVWQAKMAAE